MITLEEYRRIAAEKVAAFQELFGEEAGIFETLDLELFKVLEHIGRRQDIIKPPLDVFLTFFVIVHRQFRSAYELYHRGLSQDGNVVMRVAIECLCHGYKLLNNPNLEEVYKNKNDSKEKYNLFKTEFEYNLFIKDMPNKVRLKQIRDLINKSASHPDIDYCCQVVESKREQIIIHYYDHNEDFFKLQLMQFIECFWLCIDVIRSSLDDFGLLPLTMTTSTNSWVLVSKKFIYYKNRNRKWAEQFTRKSD